MSSSANTVTVWVPSPKQEEVAQRYAIGYTWHRASVLTNTPYRTVADWLKVPEFLEYGEELRAQIRAAQEPRFNALIDRCQAILERVGDGPNDLAPDHALAKWAERILSKTLFKVVVVRASVGAPRGLDGPGDDAVYELGPGPDAA